MITNGKIRNHKNFEKNNHLRTFLSQHFNSNFLWLDLFILHKKIITISTTSILLLPFPFSPPPSFFLHFPSSSFCNHPLSHRCCRSLTQPRPPFEPLVPLPRAVTVAPRATNVAPSQPRQLLKLPLSLTRTTIIAPWAATTALSHKTTIAHACNHHQWWRHEIFPYLFNIPFPLCIFQDLLNLVCILRWDCFVGSMFHMVFSFCLLKNTFFCEISFGLLLLWFQIDCVHCFCSCGYFPFFSVHGWILFYFFSTNKMSQNFILVLTIKRKHNIVKVKEESYKDI